MKHIRFRRLLAGFGLLLCGCVTKTVVAPAPLAPAAPAATVPQPRPVVASALLAALQQHTLSEDGYDADVVVDPAGKWIAFSSTRHSERPDVYLQRVDGASVMQITGDPADDVHPAFSPDGKRIAFASNRGGNWDIYLMDIDGRNVEQITSGPSEEMRPSFSPDGTRLAYCALSRRTEQWELWTVNLTTRERKVIGPGLFPAWSPRKDVDRIAFQRPRQRGSRLYSLWTVDLVEGEPRRVTEVASSSNAAAVCPSWSPDGQRLVFATVLTDTGGQAQQDVWVVNADGSGRQRLTDGSGANLSPTWSVDNRIYFISDRGGHENVWSVRADSAATPVATGAAGHGASKEEKSSKIGDTSGPKNGPVNPVSAGTADTHEVGR